MDRTGFLASGAVLTYIAVAQQNISLKIDAMKPDDEFDDIELSEVVFEQCRISTVSLIKSKLFYK